MTVGQKEQIAQLTAKLEKLKMSKRNEKKNKKAKARASVLRARAIQDMHETANSRRAAVLGPRATEELGYSDFQDMQGGMAATLEPHVLASQHATGLAMAIIDPRTAKGAKWPDNPWPSYAKQTRNYLTVQAATNVSDSLGNAFAVIPDPAQLIIGYSDNDGYFTGTGGAGTGFVGVVTIPGWTELEPMVGNYRCVGISVLISPIEDLLERGGIVQGAYFPNAANDLNTWSSSGTPGTYPMDLADSQVSEYFLGSRHPLSVGMYGFWTPGDSLNATKYQAGLPGGSFQRGVLVFQITGASTVAPGDTLVNVEVVANWEFVPVGNTLSGTIDQPFGNDFSTIGHAFALLKDYPRFVANDSHVTWIQRFKRAVSKVPQFAKTVGRYAKYAEEAAGALAFLM